MKKTNPKPSPTPRPPVLRFSPTAWAKLLCLRDAGDTEIGGFGISATDDLLFVKDVRLVDQTCTWASVDMEDESVADYFDRQVDAGRPLAQFARLWIHTHPGSSAQPSGTDEATFARVFGRADWAVMFILARGGQTYARLRFNVGPGGQIAIPVEVDYGRTFDGSDEEGWLGEYARCVRVPPPAPEPPAPVRPARELVLQSADWHDMGQPPVDWYDDWFEYANDQYKEHGDDDGYR